MIGEHSLDLQQRKVTIIPFFQAFGSGLSACAQLEVVHNLHTNKDNKNLKSLFVLGTTAPDTSSAISLGNFLGPVTTVPAEASIFLLGGSPFTLFGLKPSRVSVDRAGTTIMYRKDDAVLHEGELIGIPYSAKCILDSEGCPLTLTATLGGRLKWQITTLDNTIINGIRVPSKVQLDRYPVGFHIRESTIFSLVRTSTKYSIDLDKRLLHAQIFDYRLLKNDLTANLFPPPGKPKNYAWHGRFPTREELQRLADVVWDTPPGEKVSNDHVPYVVLGLGVFCAGLAILLLRSGPRGTTKRKSV